MDFMMPATPVPPRSGLWSLRVRPVFAPAFLVLAVWAAITSARFWPWRRAAPSTLDELSGLAHRPPVVESPSATLFHRAPPLVPYPVVVLPGIYLLGGLRPAAAYMIQTSDGLVLIDSGVERDASALKAQIAALGLDWRQVRAILLTHAHLDHSGGAQHLRSATGARVYAGAGDSGVLRAGGPRAALCSAFEFPTEVLHPTTIDVELHGDESITCGDLRVRALSLAGHTPGSVCYLLERSGLRVLFGGDVISMLKGDLASRLPIRKQLGTYSAYMAPRYCGDAPAYLASLQKLLAMPAPDAVLPGHPRADPMPPDPFVSRRLWQTMLENGIAELKTLIARYQTDGADFLDGLPKELLPGLYYLGDFDSRAVYGWVAGGQFFLVNAAGGRGLVRFVQDALRGIGLNDVVPFAVVLTAPGDDLAGLEELAAAFHPRIVVPGSRRRKVEERCTGAAAVLSSDEASKQDWFQGVSVPVAGPNLPEAVYRLDWVGKTVLFTGSMPVPRECDLESLTRPLTTMAKSREATMDMLVSINRLEGIQPDLWLPAEPWAGQNANLYDRQWGDTLAHNYRLGNRMLASHD